MWIVSQHGFYNIVQYEDDIAQDILTVKARREGDLVAFQTFLPETVVATTEIETSDEADYRYRLKAPKDAVVNAVADMVDLINYSKTKGRIALVQPDRLLIYTQVWSDLYDLQLTEHDVAKPEKPAKNIGRTISPRR